MIFNNSSMDIPIDTPIWACAFATDKNGDMALYQEPIQGIITDRYSRYSKYFVPYSKKKRRENID